jgi:uncharacterized lipoprotein YddW (UPF0748 family)
MTKNNSKLFLFALFVLFFVSNAQAQKENLPPVEREFRGAWVATVRNIDWPSKPSLTVEEQKRELVAILDRAQTLKLNAIILQTRPMCDAFYQSKIEGWSRFLTGEHGKSPHPFYDPLKFAIEEAHKRGILVHAWFNPYRANDVLAKEGNKKLNLKPEYVKRYGEYFWLDPGEKAVQNYSLQVVLDVVRRYDVDGVVFDDYFYPYPITDKTTNAKIPFPDDESWTKYKYKGKLSRDDWRRDNVNQFIKRVSLGIKRIKPHVMFGISPFGIWRPEPPKITGFDAYSEIYADSLKWLQEGAVDYFAPQLYWTMTAEGHDYTMLLDWWREKNKLKRHLWPAIYTSKYDAQEITAQIETAQQRKDARGTIHFSMKALMKDDVELSRKLKDKTYSQNALIPESSWIKFLKPLPPIVNAIKDNRKRLYISFRSPNREKVFQWVIYKKSEDGWTHEMIEGYATSIIDFSSSDGGPLKEYTEIAVAAVNRLGQMSKPTIVKVNFSNR